MSAQNLAVFAQNFLIFKCKLDNTCFFLQNFTFFATLLPFWGALEALLKQFLAPNYQNSNSDRTTKSTFIISARLHSWSAPRSSTCENIATWIERRGATQGIYCTAELLLPSLWDGTASGTARSTMLGIFILMSLGTNIETSWTKYWGKIHAKSFVQLVSSWRFPWTWGYGSPTLCFSLFQRQFCPIMEGGADQLCSLSSVLLLGVPEAVSSHKERRSRSSDKPILCVAPLYPRGSLVPYKSKEYHCCGALLTERTFFLARLTTVR